MEAPWHTTCDIHPETESLTLCKLINALDDSDEAQNLLKRRQIHSWRRLKHHRSFLWCAWLQTQTITLPILCISTCFFRSTNVLRKNEWNVYSNWSVYLTVRSCWTLHVDDFKLNWIHVWWRQFRMLYNDFIPKDNHIASMAQAAH